VCLVMLRPAKPALLTILRHGFTRVSEWPDLDELDGNNHALSGASDPRYAVPRTRCWLALARRLGMPPQYAAQKPRA